MKTGDIIIYRNFRNLHLYIHVPYQSSLQLCMNQVIRLPDPLKMASLYPSKLPHVKEFFQTT